MRLLIFSALLTFCCYCHGQLTTAPDGGNKKASVSERIGITDVTIEYNRPAVKGREGQIWGKLVHTGFADLGFGTSKAAPWRAGANENTTITFSTDVKVEGQALPAGRYALFLAYKPEECTLIFSNNSTSWGSFYYDEKEDALRVKVKPVPLNESVEWLKYEFSNETPAGATVNLLWEKLKIPFKVEVDLNRLQIESFKRELRTDKSFNSTAWQQAAQFTLTNDTDLEQGLVWAEQAINAPFFGEANFGTLSTKAQILQKLHRTNEADSLMKRALPLATMNQVHQYARQLPVQKKTREAFDVFKHNSEKYPNTFTTHMGMMRAYSATGNYKKALEFAQKSLLLAPDPGNKVNIETYIKMLGEGKNIN